MNAGALIAQDRPNVETLLETQWRRPLASRVELTLYYAIRVRRERAVDHGAKDEEKQHLHGESPGQSA